MAIQLERIFEKDVLSALWWKDERRKMEVALMGERGECWAKV